MSDYIKKIRTTSGDKQIDYTALANLPSVNGQPLVGDITVEGVGGGSVTGDTLPIGSIVDYEGTEAPSGWIQVEDEVEFTGDTVPVGGIIEYDGTDTPTGWEDVLDDEPSGDDLPVGSTILFDGEESEIPTGWEKVEENYYVQNLLVNGDFQINQRGLSNLNITSGWQYFIDMWKGYNLYVNLAFDNYFSVVVPENTMGYIVQNFDKPAGIYTMQIKVRTIHRGNINLYLEGTSTSGQFVIDTIGVHNFTFNTSIDLSGVVLELNNFYGDIEYVALHEGSIAYPHIKEDYAIALMRCRRYIRSIVKGLNICFGLGKFYNGTFYIPLEQWEGSDFTDFTVVYNGSFTLYGISNNKLNVYNNPINYCEYNGGVLAMVFDNQSDFTLGDTCLIQTYNSNSYIYITREPL